MLVKAPYIKEAALRDPLPLPLRPYGAPFVPLYALFYHYYTVHYDRVFGTSQWTLLYLGGILSLHVLVWLMPFWNTRIAELFETRQPSSSDSAQLIKLVPASGAGTAAIVPIKRWDDGEISFVFQQRRFLWNEKDQCFAPPHFWVYDQPTVGELLAAKGLGTSRAHLEKEFGSNAFDIPVPGFWELWKEHAVAPFFVFQIFSVVLWLLDEKWKSSLFSLIMIVSFESTVVFQRQRTMTEFRSMGVKPYELFVFREKRWLKLSTTELLPGDVVSVVRSPEDSGVACDLVLLSGSAVVNEAMLSGESTPLLKESVADRDAADKVDIDSIDKNSLLSGGTKALQVTAGPAIKNVPLPPDNGAIAMVARTGFETTQGQLVRTMIFSAERVGSGNREAYLFILFLLVFAVAASWYVWVHGIELGRHRGKLLLDCVLIITSVVPPELPMELTLAVNSSLAALAKYYIYCTEPFRIPYAGRIDVCCFDKTGTLTEEDLIVQGIVLPGQTDITGPKQVPRDVALVLASAHALVLLDDGEVVGDPMEQNTLKSVGWQVLANDEVRNVANPTSKVRILKRFQFSSALKRSSTVVSVPDNKQQLLVAVKGAPETIQSMLTTVPEGYEQTYKQYTRQGSRVLAFAKKTLQTKSTNITHYTRDQAEAGLEFVGFLVFHCPLKPDAIEIVKMLAASSHRVMMITGDNPLTALSVAHDVGIVERNCIVLDEADNGHLEWLSPDDDSHETYTGKGWLKFNEADLCVTGSALARIQATEDRESIERLVKHTWVWARVSPAQKEFILATLREQGYMTLMCGDGTNDVGALKQAHLGIALLNGTDEGMKKMGEQAREAAVQRVYEKQVDLMKRWGGKPPPVPKPIAHLYPPGPQNPHYAAAITERGGTIDEATMSKIREMTLHDASRAQAASVADKMSSMLNDEENDSEPPQLKLGDASCAAPLTSKLRNVSAVSSIIRQGRCTLVATIQMYKILALNCLISAYTLSVLFLAGIKMSDGQSLIAGVLVSMCFTSISRARAVDDLSKERPQPGIFNKYIMGSIMGQFAVHVWSLVVINAWVLEIEPPSDVDLDSPFEPSLLNTAMYLLQLIQQISTFAVNYQGRPFREALSENRGMYYGVLGCLGLGFAGATELLPEMNEALGLVPMALGFKVKLTLMMLADLGLCYAIEYGLKYLYSDYKPADIALTLEERKKELVQ